MKEMDNKWHYTKDNDYPTNDNPETNLDPDILCLVEKKGYGAMLLNWSPYYLVWDDDEGDNYFCDKEEVIRWRFVKPLLNEK